MDADQAFAGGLAGCPANEVDVSVARYGLSESAPVGQGHATQSTQRHLGDYLLVQLVPLRYRALLSTQLLLARHVLAHGILRDDRQQRQVNADHEFPDGRLVTDLDSGREVSRVALDR
jgi:hypothetical protein